MAEPARVRPAFYATDRGRAGDWWTLLHPPYTAWHLSYVLLGAAVAPTIDVRTLLATLLAFFFAVGISAHALDELQGRPLRTRIADRTLWVAALGSLAVAVGIGVAGIARLGPGLVGFIVVGTGLVLAYNLELFGGRLHTDGGFALAWGAFPVLTSAYAQTQALDLAALAIAAAAFGLSWSQRALSTPVRHVRRRIRSFEVRMETHEGEVTRADARVLLTPIERALHGMSWGLVALGLGLVVARL